MVRVYGEEPAQQELDRRWAIGLEHPELVRGGDYIHIHGLFGDVVPRWVTKSVAYLAWRDEGVIAGLRAKYVETGWQPYVELCRRLRRRNMNLARVISLPRDLAEDDWRQFLLQVHFPFFSFMCIETLYLIREGQGPFHVFRREDFNWAGYFASVTGYDTFGEVDYRDFLEAGTIKEEAAIGFMFQRYLLAKRFGVVVRPAEFPY